MAVPNPNISNALELRLDYLLRRARDVKQSTSIDPPLQVSELVQEKELLLGEVEGEKEVRLLAVESAAKCVFYANLVSPPPAIRGSLLMPQGIHTNRTALICHYLESS